MNLRRKVWLFSLSLGMLIGIAALEVDGSSRAAEEKRKLREDYLAERELRIAAEESEAHWRSQAALRVNTIEIQADVMRATYKVLPQSILRMKSKHLTWDDVRRMAPEINSGRITIEGMHADARGVAVLLLSKREHSEILPEVLNKEP